MNVGKRFSFLDDKFIIYDETNGLVCLIFGDVDGCNQTY